MGNAPEPQAGSQTRIESNAFSRSLGETRSRALRVAGTGPTPMTAGSTPATAVATTRASGRRPSSAAFSDVVTMHIDAAVKHGATREEVLEALGVAIAINAGAALVYSARAMDAFTARSGEARAE